MGLLKANKRISVPELSFKRGTVTRFNGVVAPRVVSAVFNPSANTAQRPIGTYGLGVYIPTKAVITKAWIDVITTFTTASADAGTIAVQVQAANDVVSAIAVSAAGDVWDAGIRGTKIGSYALDGNANTAIVVAALMGASMLKLTAEREVSVVVGGQALTAGKMVIYIEYTLGE